MADSLLTAQLPDAFRNRFPLSGETVQPGIVDEPRIDRGASNLVHDPRTQAGPADLDSLGVLIPRLGINRVEPGAIVPPDDLGIRPFRTDRVSDQEATEIKRQISQLGTERLAWYDTFRQPTWGITIRSTAIEMIAHVLRSETPQDWHERTAVAAELLYRHEYAHFLFDVAASTLEDFEGRPLWLPFHLSPLNRPWSKREEALCNAFAYSRVKRGWKSPVAAFMRGQPPGYCDFQTFAKPEAFTAGVEQHLHSMVYGSHEGISVKNWRPLFQDHEHGMLSPTMVPLYILHG